MKQNWFVRGDIDGFFGLFIDNLLQLMLMVALCPAICGIPLDFVTHTILPGAALSILFGNLFYGWQAVKLAEKTGRTDVTALPFGINTPSLVAFVFLIMGPVYQETKDSGLAWKAGLFACFLNGAIETIGAFLAEPLRRNTPRAALLSALAGIAITFIAMGFIFQMFAQPLVSVAPALLILACYASGVKFPGGLPGGLGAVLVGVAIAWVMKWMGHDIFHAQPAAEGLGLRFPRPAFSDAVSLFSSPLGWRYFSIVLPMGLFNLIGSLQNLESAEAAGDRYETRPSLLVNGLGTLVAAFFGSPFPPTIYIGHPGWKAMGARAGYSILNGTVICALCLIGGVGLILRFVPVEATLGILLWIGIIITAQAFQEVPKKHALAVALGLVPSLAAWALFLVETSLRAGGSSLAAAFPKFGDSLYISGVVALSQGFVLTSMLLSAALAFIIDRAFLKAAGWTFAAAAFSALGLIHAYKIGPGGVENVFGWMAAPSFAMAYLISGCGMVWFHFAAKKDADRPTPRET
jgi:AGZA family xanthine/uracil permease-like MFS transporter